MPAPLPPEPSSSPDKASHRYLQPKARGDKHQNGGSNNKNGVGYYARDNVTRRARRPIAMANLDDSDLDPLWQNLDWYVPSILLVSGRNPDAREVGCRSEHSGESPAPGCCLELVS